MSSDTSALDNEGTAGIGAAQQILNLLRSSGKTYTPGDIAIVDAAEWHHYQPGWTLVGSGLKRKHELRRPLQSLIPTPYVAHHAERLQSFNPESNSVQTESGKELTYDTLVVAPGLKVKFEAIEGLPKALADPGSGVSSIYSYDTCDKAWADIDAMRNGKAVFTQPAGVIKCAGAPQKVGGTRSVRPVDLPAFRLDHVDGMGPLEKDGPRRQHPSGLCYRNADNVQCTKVSRVFNPGGGLRCQPCS